MEHQFTTPEECNCNGENWHCPICVGGLAHCKICKGFEGSLTTECCGRPLTGQESDQIYEKGTLDFRNGKWVNEPNPCNQVPTKYRKENSMAKQNPEDINFIVRNRENPAEQMQLIYSAKDNKIGVISNSNMELLIIESSFSMDRKLTLVPVENDGSE